MWYKFDITITTKLNFTIISLTQIEIEIEKTSKRSSTDMYKIMQYKELLFRLETKKRQTIYAVSNKWVYIKLLTCEQWRWAGYTYPLNSVRDVLPGK